LDTFLDLFVLILAPTLYIAWQYQIQAPKFKHMDGGKYGNKKV
jgi:hypothetical protein